MNADEDALLRQLANSLHGDAAPTTPSCSTNGNGNGETSSATKKAFPVRSYCWNYVTRLPEGNMRCNICNIILQSHHTTNAKKHIAAKHGIKGGPPPSGDGQSEFLGCFDSPHPSDQSLILNDITMKSSSSPLLVECYTPPAKKMNLEQSIFDFVQSALGKSVDVPSTLPSSPGEKQPKESVKLTDADLRMARVLSNPKVSASFVEDPDLREILLSGQDNDSDTRVDNAKLPATAAEVEDLLSRALRHLKSRIDSQLRSAASSLSISVHVWRPSKEETDTLVAVTAHFVDHTLHLAKALLGVETLSGDNVDVQSLKALVDSILQSYGIDEEQVFAYVTNNMSQFSARITSWQNGIASVTAETTASTMRPADAGSVVPIRADGSFKLRKAESPSATLGSELVNLPGEDLASYDASEAEMSETFRKRRECFPLALQRCLQELIQGSFAENKLLNGTRELPSSIGGWLGYYVAAQRSLTEMDVDDPLIDEAALFLNEFVQLLKPFCDTLASFSSTAPTLPVVYGHVQNLFYHVDTAFQTADESLLQFRSKLKKALHDKFDHIVRLGSPYGIAALLDPCEAFCVEVDAFQSNASLLSAVRKYYAAGKNERKNSDPPPTVQPTFSTGVNGHVVHAPVTHQFADRGTSSSSVVKEEPVSVYDELARSPSRPSSTASPDSARSSSEQINNCVTPSSFAGPMSYRDRMLALRREEKLRKAAEQNDLPSRVVKEHLETVIEPWDKDPLEFWRSKAHADVIPLRKCALDHLAIPASPCSEPQFVIRDVVRRYASDMQPNERLSFSKVHEKAFVYLNRHLL